MEKKSKIFKFLLAVQGPDVDKVTVLFLLVGYCFQMKRIFLLLFHLWRDIRRVLGLALSFCLIRMAHTHNA
jgi:hypothetical protein